MTTKQIDIPIFGGKITIIIDKDLSYVQKKYKTRCLKDFGAVTFRDKSEFKSYVVSFEELDYSLIAHESVHIVNFLFTDIGIELCRDNDELQAYLTGWIFEEILKAFKK